MKRPSAQSSRAEPASFVDILEERRRGSDISHALRAFSPPPGCGAPPPSPSALNKMVLESQHLRYVVLEVAAESGKPQARVREEAAALLDEMSQNLQVTFIRLLGFALSKIFTRLFRRIQVNEDGLARLQQATQEHPVILMPNHRSYVDFLVLSYIMFTYDLSIPVIAAGIPLMGMSLIGEIFRRSGAFFIRRAIGSDKLYWAVLSEYVRTIVRTGFAPVEFYVEGLRSRTLKSLTPKMGMMHMVLEPFLKGEVYDLSLVPVSISYDRVLEESLLAHELLGVPKPRETTRGLLKARRVLEQDYGSMHVYFGNPVSVRELAKGRIGRGQYNLVPRDLPGRPSEESQAFASAAAHRVVRLQERGTVLSPWSLTALLVLQRPDGTRWDLLARDTLWLRGIALQLGARLDWPADLPDLEVMSSSMALHRSVVRCEEGCVWLVEEAGPEPVTQEEGVFRRASAVLMCASYRNQALHVFTRPAMVAVAMGTVPGHSQDIYRHFCFLRDLFANEFVFVPGCGPQDFEEGCSGLQQCGAVSATDHELKPTEEERDTIVFLSAILEPFIETYQVVFRILCDERLQVFTEKSFVPAVRADAMKLLISGEARSHECLSSDTQKNVLSALLRMGAVSKSGLADHVEYRINRAAVRRIWQTLVGRVTPQMKACARL
ncbi:dihydroxyacetone phosphate acyltransferase isoform X2 [Electrophorus electricus]|uniref:dihydroxyacetone phosphate acyltransferase isoform X2 n=1 Tax=Electrophorus electricus TaxID=8005 RepID=UPI0015D075D5|nr:dihydroxyacetone phosphate acyltransferase isoform X2 [Electrophorus electricus]